MTLKACGKYQYHLLSATNEIVFELPKEEAAEALGILLIAEGGDMIRAVA
jgi:hypothetical protein